MEIDNDQQDPKDNPKKISSLIKNNQDKKETTKSPTYHDPKKENAEKLYFGIFRIADIIQILGIIITAGTLIAFIYISNEQIGISNRAISQTDSVIAYTKKSVNISEINTLSSDSSTRRALKISDSTLSIGAKSLNIAYENIRIMKENAKIELRAYVQVDSIYFTQFKVGEKIKISIRISNVGKTPAYNLKMLLRSKWGGTGVYLNDYLTLKDTVSSMSIPANNGYIIITDNIGNFFLDRADSSGVINGKLYLGYYAKIFYDDIFGKQDSVIICRKYNYEEKKFELCDNINEVNKPQ